MALLISFLRIRALDLVITCYMKEMGTMRHEEITKTWIGGPKTRNAK